MILIGFLTTIFHQSLFTKNGPKHRYSILILKKPNLKLKEFERQNVLSLFSFFLGMLTLKNEVNQKVLTETEQKGIEQGRIESMEEVARNLKDDVDIRKLSAVTGLSIDEIKGL